VREESGEVGSGEREELYRTKQQQGRARVRTDSKREREGGVVVNWRGEGKSKSCASDPRSLRLVKRTRRQDGRLFRLAEFPTPPPDGEEMRKRRGVEGRGGF
jgi:hypothetical protein